MKPQKRTTHFRGRIITLTTDEVRLPNGHLASLEVVHHPGGAAAVAVDDQERVCLLRQYRYVADGWLWELPAGKLEPDEPPLVTAQRELIEEAGVSAREWRSLGSYLSSPGIFTEVLHLFTASDLEAGDQAFEDDEDIEVVTMPVAAAVDEVRKGTIIDSKSVAAVFWAQLYQAGDPGALALCQEIA